jgi:hypothetical protein
MFVQRSEHEAAGGWASAPRGEDMTTRLPSPLARFSDAEWHELFVLLVVFARRVTGGSGFAEGLTREALAQLLSTRPWDPSEQPSLPLWVMGIIKALRADLVSSDRREGAADADEAERRLALLRSRLDEWSLEQRLIDLTVRGIDDPGAQAERTGRPLEEVYRARLRLHQVAQGVAEVDAHAHPQGARSGSTRSASEVA